MKRFIALLVMSISMLSVWASIPKIINFQGALTNASGQAVNNSVDITFRIYDQDFGGNLLWEETQIAVSVLDGIFNVTLGNVTSFPSNLFDNSPIWLTFRISGEVDEMYPRKKILPVPYALNAVTANTAAKADTATTIDGTSISELVTKDISGNAMITGTMTANAFIGNGSGLTGISGSLNPDFINSTGPDSMQSSTSYLSTLTIKSTGYHGNALELSTTSNGGCALKIANSYTGISIDSTLAGYSPIYINHSSGDAISVNNSVSKGLEIYQSGSDGISINKTGGSGLTISDAQDDGIYISEANDDGLHIHYANSDGVQIDSTRYDGIYIDKAGSNGIEVRNSHDNGIKVENSDYCGIKVINGSNEPAIYSYSSTNFSGIFGYSSGGAGIIGQTSNSNGEYGFYTENKSYVGGGITTRTINTIGLNTGNQSLEAGDIVCIAGGYQTKVSGENGLSVINVEKLNAFNQTAVIGVVEYAVKIRKDIEKDETGREKINKSFHHKNGKAANGEYVTIIIVGPADVKISHKKSVTIGERLTISGKLHSARPIKASDSWISTPILGKALENSNGKDKMKIFVNCK